VNPELNCTLMTAIQGGEARVRRAKTATGGAVASKGEEPEVGGGADERAPLVSQRTKEKRKREEGELGWQLGLMGRAG
jgi:hypothetical protein